jgi:outer membrane receptor protein involved in Fe transport
VGLTAKLGQNATVAHSAHVNWLRSTSAYASTFGDSEVEANRSTARYQLDWNRTHSPVSAGVEWSGEQEDNTYITGDAFQPIPVQRSMAGFFAEIRPSFSDRLFASIGVRSDRIERKPLTTDGFGRPPFDEQVVWSTNPKVAFAWLLSQGGDDSSWGWTKLRFGAGTGIKAPTAFEIAFTNNPDLKPERSKSVDAGVEQALASSRVIADATWFFNSYDDLIISVGSALAGASRFRTDNIANARAQGLEFGVSWHPTLTLAIRGAWTWLDTDVLDVDSVPGEAPPPYNVGDSLIRRPSSSGSFDVRWSGGLMSAFLAVSGRGSMLDIEPSLGRSTVTNPGFVTTSMGAAVRVHRAVEVYARLNNSFDRYYEDACGYPALGRSASFGVRVTSSR